MFIQKSVKYTKNFQFVTFTEILKVFHIEKIKPFSKYSDNISNGHSLYTVSSAYTFSPKVFPKIKISKILCVILLLQPLQKSEHANFDTRFLAKYFKVKFQLFYALLLALAHKSFFRILYVRLVALVMGYQNI